MRRTAAEAAETRSEILRAALTTFATDGWQRASLELIARRAEVTRGAIYHHFADKTDLLQAVLTDGWEEHAEPSLRRLADPALPPPDRLRGFLGAQLDGLATDADFRALAVVSTLVAQHAFDLETGIAGKREAMTHWRSGLAAALEESRLRAGLTVDDAIFVILTFLHGVTLTAAAEPDRLPTGPAAAAIADAVIAGVLR